MALRKQMQRSPSIISYFEEADWSNSYSEESSSENVGGIGSSSNSEDTSNSQTSTNHHQDEIRRLIQNETKGVIMWRYVVTAIMVITACFVSVSTYIFLSREETDTFERGVSSYCSRLYRINIISHFILCYLYLLYSLKMSLCGLQMSPG